MEHLPEKNERLVNQLQFLPGENTVIQFGADDRITVYYPFDASLTDQELGLEWSSLSLHAPYDGDYLPVTTVDSLTEIISLQPELVIPPAIIEEYDYIDDQAENPETLDVTHLIPERKQRMETLLKDLQAYAAYAVSERPITPTEPSIILFNEQTAKTVRAAVDPLQWLADGLITITWKGREQVGISKEGPYVDMTPLLNLLLDDIGIDYEQALITVQKTAFRYKPTSSRPIDEATFVPEAAESIIDWATRNVSRELGPNGLTIANGNTAGELLTKLRRIADSHGYTIGYRHRYVSDYVAGGTKHDFMLMTPDGRFIEPIIPDGRELHDIDDVQLALEEAYRSILERIKLIDEVGGV